MVEWSERNLPKGCPHTFLGAGCTVYGQFVHQGIIKLLGSDKTTGYVRAREVGKVGQRIWRPYLKMRMRWISHHPQCNEALRDSLSPKFTKKYEQSSSNCFVLRHVLVPRSDFDTCTPSFNHHQFLCIIWFVLIPSDGRGYCYCRLAIIIGL